MEELSDKNWANTRNSRHIPQRVNGLKKIINYLKTSTYRSPDRAIKEWSANLKEPDAEKGNVLITALRNRTWIEWAVYSAFAFRQMGYKSTLLYKQSEIKSQYSGTSFWKIVSDTSFIDLVDLDGFEPDLGIIEKYIVTKPKFLYDALAYNYHIEREDIIANEKDYSAELNELIIDSARAHHGIVSELTQKNYKRFICYSGLIQTTPTLFQAAREAGLPTMCVEGWPWRIGHIIYNYNQPALEIDIKGWINYYGWDEEQNQTIKEYHAFQDGQTIDNISWLQNFYNVQPGGIDDLANESVNKFLNKYKSSFLLAPNVVGDSSTLNRETIFPGMKTWIEEVIQYFKSNPHYSLIIRAHPAEVWAKSKVKIKLGDYAENLCHGIENILVIKGEEKINSFYLLPYIKCGLVWLSSLGVDLVTRGIPVICAASPKYSGLGFVHEPSTKEEYFNLIREYADCERRSTTDDEKLSAKKYLFVVFKGFSFPAQGSDYSAKTLKLNNMPHQEEHDRFYKILIGEIERPDASN